MDECRPSATREAGVSPLQEAGPRGVGKRRLVLAGLTAMVGIAFLLAARSLWRPAEVELPDGHGGTQRRLAHDEQPSAPPAEILREPAFSANATVEDLNRETAQAAGRLAERFPNDPDALLVLARVQYAMGKKAEAVRTWEKCVRLTPDSVEAYDGMAHDAAERGDYETAAAFCRKTLSLAPRDPRVPALLADALVKLDRIEELVAELEGIAKGGSASVEVALALGQAQLRLRHYDKARLAFEVVIRADPANRSAHYALATVYAMLGQEGASQRHREEFGKLSATDIVSRRERISAHQDLPSVREIAVQTYRGAGRVYARYGDTASAEAMWRCMALLDGKDVESRNQLASLYERTDRGEQALRMCEELRDIEPANPDHWLNVGLLSARLGRFDAAETAVQRAIQLDPQNRRYREAYEVIRKSR
jgi:tetratricopeptide (TPR) repeat protein